ncbi:MAG TPA: dTDP-4-dehydrorhamnose 3,5-epimerase [Sphingomicrobium sp.]|nr:dTDP-4-dehydrorhamnose 3,5-epimerase [Sphingomicrobium sp.]
MIEVAPTALHGVVEIRPRQFSDDRGFFSETWNRAAMAEAGLDHDFVQDNHSLSIASGVLRGLHFQVPPAAQVKLVRVSRGAIFDVAVDIRRASPTFGQWVGVTLSAEAWNQLLIPHGFAHGFLTLEERTEVQYKVSSVYDPAAERTIRWDDPDLAIDWPVREGLILSDKDRAAPSLSDVETGF